MPLSAGVLIAGRYRIVRLLGEGGFGAVYLAEDIRLGNKTVAVKESFDSSREAQEQFRLEAQLLANLQHIGLPRVTDHFLEPDGRQFLVMDFIEGEDLDQRVIRANRPLAEREAAQLMLQVCEAVAYLHTRRPQPVIHRDIKPPNIKITRDGRAVLVDFGIAKIYHPTKGTARVAKAVTPHFSPPEQYIGKTDERSDVYALGATLYCLVAAAVPPDAMERLTHGARVPPPSRLNPGLSQDLETIILQALDLDPEKRFSNANRMAAALTSFLAGRTTQPEPAGVKCPCCGWVNRAGARFCAKDGFPLSGAQPAAHAATPPPAPPAPLAPPAPPPLDPEMLFEMANALARKSDFAAAIPRYETCLQQGFQDQAVFHNLAICYLEQDRPGEAASLLQKGASLHPQDSDLQFQLARALLAQDQTDLALAAAQRACLLDPRDPANQRLYAAMLFDAKRYPEAIRQLEKCVQMEPQSAVPHLLLGRAYGASNDLKKAINSLRKAAQLEPGSAEPHFWTGLFYHTAKKYHDAVQALENALRLKPDYVPALYLLAESWLSQDQYARALPYFQRAAQLEPGDADYQTRMGVCYALLSRRTEARAALQQALRLDPGHQQAREVLAKL